MGLGRPDIYRHILEEHFDSLEFLVEQRAQVSDDPEWTLQDMAELEERIEAHLDGLRVGELLSVDLVAEHLAGDEPAQTAAATMVLLALDSDELAERVIDALAVAEQQTAQGIRLGLLQSRIERCKDSLLELADSGAALPAACAIDVLTFHGVAHDYRLDPLIENADDAVRQLALVAAGRVGADWSESQLRRALQSGSGQVRRVALETSARLGVANLPAICRELAQGERACPEAVAFLGVLGAESDRALLEACLEHGELARAALSGIGALGSPESVTRLLAAIADEELARAAGAAFVRITAAEDILGGERPAPPPDMPEDEADLLDDSFLPDAELAAAWWAREGQRFAAGRRWQCGMDITDDALIALQGLVLPARRDVYLRLRYLHPNETPLLELSRPAREQLGPS